MLNRKGRNKVNYSGQEIILTFKQTDVKEERRQRGRNERVRLQRRNMKTRKQQGGKRREEWVEGCIITAWQI